MKNSMFAVLASIVALAAAASPAFAVNTNYVWTFSPNSTYYNTSVADILLINTTSSPGFMWINYSGYSGNVSLVSPYNGTLNLAKGANNFTIYVNDSSGVMNTSTPFTVNVDTNIPTLTVTTTGGIKEYTSSFYISGTCADSGIAGVDSVGTTSAYFTAVNTSDAAAWTLVNTSAIPTGWHTVTVYCNDTYRNLGSASYIFAFSNDLTPGSSSSYMCQTYNNLVTSAQMIFIIMGLVLTVAGLALAIRELMAAFV